MTQLDYEHHIDKIHSWLLKWSNSSLCMEVVFSLLNQWIPPTFDVQLFIVLTDVVLITLRKCFWLFFGASNVSTKAKVAWSNLSVLRKKGVSGFKNYRVHRFYYH